MRKKILAGIGIFSMLMINPQWQVADFNVSKFTEFNILKSSEFVEKSQVEQVLADTTQPHIDYTFYRGGTSYTELVYDEKGYVFGDGINMVCDLDIITGSETVKMTVTSSDESVAKIDEKDKEYIFDANATYNYEKWITIEICGVGKTTITTNIGGVKKSINVYVAPYTVDVKGIVQTGYNQATITWKKISGCDGYMIQRSVAGEDKFSTVKTIESGNVNSTTVQSPWETEYTYRVIGYVKHGNKKVFYENCCDEVNFTIEKTGSLLKSVKKSGKSALQLKWTKVDDASGYEVYCGATQNGKYKKVYATSNEKITSYKHKVTAGQTYYYYVVTKYPNGYQCVSDSISGYISKKKKAVIIQQKKIKQNASFGGSYSMNWAVSDTSYYYVADKKLHMVCVEDEKLRIYTLNSSTLKPTKTKTIKLGAYDMWGGFCQGTDGKFYVAVGYNNFKEKDNKTVIKVYQYSSKWKKQKTCKIKGDAKNYFKGIYIPFRAGNCRMETFGNVLYLYTAREMYESSDGLHHQSNIAFRINTKTMKYECAEESYCSHSFNQFVKYKDGDLYQVDHGDAYPRGIALTITKQYGTKTQDTTSETVFKIKGETGDNYTGVTIGGTEVGRKNVLICGTAQPHKYKIKGVTGFGYELKHNVYVIVADKETGKAKVKWLTKYNPKTSTTTVGETRMVKLSDEYFAILYNTTDKNDVTKLHYVVVNNNGKKVYSKTYAGMSSRGYSQPILYQGNIIWTESNWNATYSDTNAITYRIPAIYE